MSAIPDIPPDEAVSYQQMFHANPQSMWIYAQDTLNTALVMELNAEVSVSELDKDIDEIGYPQH